MKAFKLLTILFFTWANLIFAQNFNPPDLTGPVIDEPGLLSDRAFKIISQTLYNYNQQYDVQFQVAYLDSINGVSIEEASIAMADKWKLGRKGADNAAILIIALKERKMRIEVGRGLEGDLTDLKSKRIIEAIRPYFKNQKYDEGTALALQLMGETIHKEIKFQDGNFARNLNRNKAIHLPFPVIIIIFILAIFIFSILPSRRGYYRGGNYHDDHWGSGGGFSGGGGSGGGWSGGGGGFSGGGASGDF